ncbi:hypothetical protein U9M48_001217 [Paspalum notatum var. saurae]|uniref:Uncharacterized protein n=1 Tax=Paspalum notatum var. saurae TaxID=547442 RepID=A0AAQ3PN87_PASNO
MSFPNVHTMVTVILVAVMSELHRADRVGFLNVDRLRARIHRALVRIRLRTVLGPYRLLGLGICRRHRRRRRLAPRPVVLNPQAPAPAPARTPTAYPPGYCPDHGWHCPNEAGPSRAAPARAELATAAASSRLPTPTPAEEAPPRWRTDVPPTRAARTGAPPFYTENGTTNAAAPAQPTVDGFRFPPPHLLAQARRHAGEAAARRPGLRLPNGAAGDSSSSDEGEGRQ